MVPLGVGPYEERLTSFALKARMQESEEAVMNGGVQRI